MELIELREVDTARALLRNAAVFSVMRKEEPDRYLRMEHLCQKTYFDIKCVFFTGNSKRLACIKFSQT